MGDSPLKARVQELFHEVADLPAAARAGYFTEHSVDDETRREVEALLAFDSGTNALLAHEISVAADDAISGFEAMGARYGPYRLLEQIGRGGMGAVYLAERVDGEVRQRVAVKLLHTGAGDPQRERFLQERQILAALSHPHIARMLDAGHGDNGQPFLALEYVEGIPIDVFAAGLTVRQKIALFLKVCGAVSYLHRNVVVHRDLKPSNILVTSDGEPKLLDFGIAKMLDLATDSTMTFARVLTPDYASPEQVKGGAVSTAMDIYSLGAVLYRLLTGKCAHEFKDHSAEAIAEAIVVREVTRPGKWAPELKGDLESILVKALRKDPQERYGTVEQFAEDLDAFLNSRSVRARAGGVCYHGRKFLRRYWLPVTAAFMTIAGLSIGLLVANRERAIAQRRFNDVRQLANQLFTIDRQVFSLPGSTKARQLIVDTSLEYLNRLTADAGNDPDLALDLGAAYMRVARVQGVPISANLGQADNAEKNLLIAERLIASVLRVQPANHMAHLRAMQIAHDRMVLAESRRPDTEALPLGRQAEAWMEKYLAGGKVDELEKQQVVIAGMNIASWYSRKDLTDESLRLTRRTIELAKALNLPAQAGAAQISAARALRSMGDLEGALAAVGDGARLLEPLSANAASATTFSLLLSTEGDVLGSDQGISMGRYREAADSFNRAYRIVLPLARLDADAHNELIQRSAADRGVKLAGVVRRWDARRALELYDEALAVLARVADNRDARRAEVRALAGSTYPLRQLGRSGEARRRLGTAFLRMSEMKLYPAKTIEPGSVPVEGLRAQAEMEAGAGSLRRGIEIYQELIGKLTPVIKPETRLEDAIELSEVYLALAQMHRRARQPDLGSAVDARRLELWRQWDRKLRNNPFVQRQLAGVAPNR